MLDDVDHPGEDLGHLGGGGLVGGFFFGGERFFVDIREAGIGAACVPYRRVVLPGL